MDDATINATANLNRTDCIRSASKFGETVYHNICNGTVTTVEWGGADWALAFVLLALGIGFTLLILGMAKHVIFDTF